MDRDLPAVLLLVAGCGSPATAAAELREEASVPVLETAGLVFVELGRDGEALLALLDTGATASAVDPRCAADLPAVDEALVVGTTGTLAAEVVELEGLRLGSLRLPTLYATRRALSGLLAPPGRSVDLILGSDALAELAVTIDFPAGRIEILRESAPRKSERAPQRGKGQVPMALDAGVPCIAASIGGIDMRLRIDTGASLFETPDVYVNVPARFWETLRARHPGLAPSSSLVGTGADGRSVQLDVVEVPGARVGPLELERVFVIVQPEAGYFAGDDAKGFVSNNLLRKLGRVTLDYRAERLRWEGGEGAAPSPPTLVPR